MWSKALQDFSVSSFKYFFQCTRSTTLLKNAENFNRFSFFSPLSLFSTLPGLHNSPNSGGGRGTHGLRHRTAGAGGGPQCETSCKYHYLAAPQKKKNGGNGKSQQHFGSFRENALANGGGLLLPGAFTRSCGEICCLRSTCACFFFFFFFVGWGKISFPKLTKLATVARVGKHHLSWSGCVFLGVFFSDCVAWVVLRGSEIFWTKENGTYVSLQ